MPGDAPQGLCPNCVLKAGFQTDGGSLGAESGSAHGPDTRFVPPTPAELAPHFADLEILEVLGHGGMGVVYKARQKHLDRLVALKILSPKIGRDAAFQERFAREARAMAMLAHPHIVAVHDFGQTRRPPVSSAEGTESDDALYYFVMEFVDGINLRQLLDTGKLSPKEALAIVPPICDALQYAHDHGVVHRDIKPENVLLDKEGRVKIADFGLAKLVGLRGVEGLASQAGIARDGSVRCEPLTATGHVMGTPHYMAPEQIEHPQQVDHRADIYSLGVVFYQMLTGELPIGRFAAPSKKVQIDVRLDEVVLRALEKEPDRRYQQAREVKTQVETIVATTPPAAVVSSVASAPGEHAIDEARQQVRGPAIGLLIVGIVNLLTIPPAVLAFVYWNLSFIPQPLGHPSVEPSVVPLSLLIVGVALIPMMLSGLIIVAALKMKRLQAYGLAITVSILSIVSPVGLIGLPIGIWALVVLSQRDVRTAFGQSRHRQPGSPPVVATRSRKWVAALGCALFLASVPLGLFIGLETVGSTRLFFFLLLLIALVALELIFGLIGWRSSAGKATVFVAAPLLLILLSLLGAAAIHEFQTIRHDFGGWPGMVRLRPDGMEREAASIVDIVERSVGPWIVSLRQGNLELVAISRHPSAGQPWWQPNGTLYPLQPFDTSGRFTLHDPSMIHRELVFRVPDDATLELRRSTPSGGAGGSGTPTLDGRALHGFRCVPAAFPESARTANLYLAVAMGPWETVDQHEGTGSYSSSGRRLGSTDWTVSFTAAVERADGSTVVSVAHTKVDQQTRVVAIDQQGQEHTASRSQSSAIGNVTQYTATFQELPLEQITEFRLQARPYHFVEFRNVALNPTNPGTIHSERSGTTLDKDLKSVAMRFMTAMRQKDLNAMKALSLGAVEGWDEDAASGLAGKMTGLSVAKLEAATKEIRDEVFADAPQLLTDIRETAMLGEPYSPRYAAVRIPGPGGNDEGHYLMSVFKRTPQGWRFVYLDDARGELVADLARFVQSATARAGGDTVTAGQASATGGLETDNSTLPHPVAEQVPQTQNEISAPDQDAFEKPPQPQGAVLIYEVDRKSAPAELSDAGWDELLKVIDRRINSGPQKLAQVRKLEDGHIEVALLRRYGEDQRRVEKLLARTGTLEFRILANAHADKDLVERALKNDSVAELLDSSGSRLAWWVPAHPETEAGFAGYPDIARRTRKRDEREVMEVLVVADPYNVTGRYLTRAEPDSDPRGRPTVSFVFNDAGGSLFGKLTGNHLPDRSADVRYRAGIILDGELFSAPTIQSTIFNKGVITGSFTKEEVSDLAEVLNSGSLPARLRLVEVKDHDTSGEDSSSLTDRGLALAGAAVLCPLAFFAVWEFGPFGSFVIVLVPIVFMIRSPLRSRGNRR